MSRYRLFDTSKLILEDLSSRISDLDLSIVKPLEKVPFDQRWGEVARRIRSARSKQASVVLALGAHVLRSGMQNYLIDLIENGYVDCLALNGAGVIHDFELALTGKTTESVAHYIKDGRFGFWKETARINDIVSSAAQEGFGLGEAVGKVIEQENFPYKNISVLAAGWRNHVPVTVHVGIGYDIIHQYPNFDGSAYGRASQLDFLMFAAVIERLEGGAVLNFGSAVMAPEVYLKALSMARNIARQEGRKINNIMTVVCDLVCLPEDYHVEARRDNPQYYFRPWKTMLVRTVADGGQSYYFQGYHAETMPCFWSALTDQQD